MLDFVIHFWVSVHKQWSAQEKMCLIVIMQPSESNSAFCILYLPLNSSVWKNVSCMQ